MTTKKQLRDQVKFAQERYEARLSYIVTLRDCLDAMRLERDAALADVRVLIDNITAMRLEREVLQGMVIQLQAARDQARAETVVLQVAAVDNAIQEQEERAVAAEWVKQAGLETARANSAEQRLRLAMERFAALRGPAGVELYQDGVPWGEHVFGADWQGWPAATPDPRARAVPATATEPHPAWSFYGAACSRPGCSGPAVYAQVKGAEQRFACAEHPQFDWSAVGEVTP